MLRQQRMGLKSVVSYHEGPKGQAIFHRARVCGMVVAAAVHAAALHSAVADHETDRPVSVGQRTAMTLGPRGDLYPLKLADPHRSTNAVQAMFFGDSEIPETGSSRVGLKLGGRFGLFRIHPKESTERGLQLNLEAGFLGEFDREQSLDGIGWDGVYSLNLSYRPRGRWRYRIGMHHTSSHVGDEYAERTGRRRVNYTREEFMFGLSPEIDGPWNVYGEAGYAYHLGNYDLLDRGRLEAGFEYQPERRFWGGRLGWYVALDLSAYEERDWRVNVAAQGGVVLPRFEDRGWRLGIELYDGRSLMGEFSFRNEQHVALALWFDF